MKKMRNGILFALALFCTTLFAEPIKIACIGDSITEGFGLANACTDSYSVILGEMLGKDYKTANFGITGKCVQRESNDPYWKSGRIPKIKQFDADIIIVKLGTNDSKPFNWKDPARFKKDYEDFLDEVSNPDKKQTIYLATGAWVKKDAIGITRKVMEEGVNPIVKQIAKERGLKIIDFHSLLENHPEWYCDDIHPNEAGAFKMAEFVYTFLTGKTKIPEVRHIRANQSDYYGYVRYDFEFRWSPTTIFIPNKPSKNREWVWISTRYKDTPAEREFILQVLKKGWHVVYNNLEGWWGNPNSVRWHEHTYKYFPKLLNLNDKPYIAGFGTGAFHAVNFTSKHPEKVEKLYLHKPTLDIIAWANSGNMKTFLREWKLKEEDLATFNDSPLTNAKKLAENNTPTVILPKDEKQLKTLKQMFGKNAKSVSFVVESEPEKEAALAVKIWNQNAKQKKSLIKR